MDAPDLLIRHIAEDVARAELLANALQRFGYVCALTTEPISAGQPALVVWTPASMNDDALIWECAEAARASTTEAPAPVYQALMAPAAGRVSIFPYTGRIPEGRWWGCVDLSEWDGAAENDQLAPLIWELPPPARPAATPPLKRAKDRWEAEWRSLRAKADIIAMAGRLQFSIRPVRSREDAAKVQDKIAEVRELGAHASAWSSYGPRTAAAAAAGPDALCAWAAEIASTHTIPDPEAPDRLRRIGAVADLLFAIQICTGFGASKAFSRDLRTEEEIIRLIEAGDGATIDAHRYEYELAQRLRSTLERLADENNPAALALLAELPKTPDYRRRLLLEKAARLGHIGALRSLIRDFERRRKYRETIPLLRRGAELGDRACKEDLARALDAGKHVRRDPKAAFALYESLLDPDYPDTQIALRVAQMKWDGDGCPRDREAAVHAFFALHIGEEAPYAVELHIGDLYRDGLGGLAKDRDEAIVWYQKSAYYGDAYGPVARKRLEELKVKVEDDDSDEEIDDDVRERIRTFWRPRA